MFPQFGATPECLSKASPLVLPIGTDAHLYDDPDDVNIGPLLDSRFDSEKVNALKRLLALLAQGADASHYYPQVVKNVVLQSLELLVSVLEIHLPMSGNVLPMHHDEDSAPRKELVDILLSNHSPGVVGAAAVVFKSVCPSSLYLIAKSFRRLYETLPDVEERSQIVLIEILLRYVVARHGLIKESIMFTSNSVLTSQEDENFAAFDGMSDNRHSSLCTSPLLWSHNSTVVFGAAALHSIMAPVEEVERITKPVLFILSSCQASKYVVIVRLACNLDKYQLPSALKYLAWTFMSEELEAKLQILNTAAKVHLQGPHAEDRQWKISAVRYMRTINW
ncbi:hypothetical protein OPV22_025893 [Ensete ventricosum]|uniref:Clathrin/coatomer adaptor adaptin-like N-terminal domain-containing protein n=1 Tax=Ensete ventricosum TaxID=4639 RepID=A0AAV8QB39_ENSVE|nr:hypothetical protein OPV22_025893 [Ensete ventricosum]